MSQLDGGGEALSVGPDLGTGLLPGVEETGLARGTGGHLTVVVRIELRVVGMSIREYPQ